MKSITARKALSRTIAAMFVGGGLLSVAMPIAQAQSGNWNVNNSGNWSTATNWSSDPTVPGNAAGDVIGLNNNIDTSVRTITIDTTSRTAGILNIGDSNNTHGFTLAASGGATLTFDNSGSGAQLNEVGSVADTISAPIILADNLTANVAGSLTHSGTFSGAFGLSKIGVGTLILSTNTSPTHTTSNVTVGTLAYRPSATGTYSFGSGDITINGGTFGFNGNSASGTYTLSNNFIVGAAGGTLDFSRGANNPNHVFSGTISLGGNLILNSNTGGGGTFQGRLSNTTTLTGNRTITLANNSNSQTEITGNITGGAFQLIIDANANNNRRLIISGDNSGLTGGIQINRTAGIQRIRFDAANSLGGGAAGSVAWSDTATIVALGFAASTADLQKLNPGAGVFLGVDGNFNLDLGGSSPYGWTNKDTLRVGSFETATTYTQTLTPGTNGYLFTANAGTTLTLSGADRLTGTNNVDINSNGVGGVIAVNNNNNLVGTVTVGPNVTLRVSGAAVTPFGAAANSIVLSAGSATLDVNGGNVTIPNVVSGTGGVSLSSAHTLILTNANTYTGPTTVSAGTLQVDGSIGASYQLNLGGGSLALNRATATTQGSQIPAYITGTGSISNIGAGTLTLNAPTFHSGTTTPTVGNITLSHALALQNSALGTTGAGTVTLSGVTTPTLGGLNGGTGDLSSVITSGYSGVTALTLNPQSGSTFTYGGAIANGAAGMTLTKTGAGTQVLHGTNTYTGTTFVNAGVLQLNYSLTGAPTADIINSASALSLGGGQLTVTGKASTTTSQTFASTAVTGGANVVANNANATANPQLVALGAITRSVGGTLNLTLPIGTAGPTNGVTSSNTTTNGIVGGWITAANNTWVGKTGGNITSGSVSYTTTATAGTTAANYTNNNIDVTNSAGTIGGVITPNSLRFNTAGAFTVTLAGGDNIIQSGGILLSTTVGNNLSTITGGDLAGSASGDLIVHQHNTSNGLTIASLIKDNTGATALTKSGAGTLTLSNAGNSYSGGNFINAGTVVFTANGNLGAAGTGITIGGNATLSNNTGTTLVDLGSRPITLNNGAIMTLTGSARPNTLIGGAITGTGGVTLTHGTFWGKAALSSTANTFSGPLTVTSSGDDGNDVFSINSVADGAGYGNIVLNNNSSDGDLIGLDYGTGGTSGTGGGGATAGLTLDHRRIILAGTGNNVFNNSSNQAVTINTDIGFSGTGARALRLGVNARAGSGLNTINGKLFDNVGGALTPTVGGGAWVFTGNNTYSGTTAITAGSLNIQHANALGDTLAGTTVSNGATLALQGGISYAAESVSIAPALPTTPSYTASAGTIPGPVRLP